MTRATTCGRWPRTAPTSASSRPTAGLDEGPSWSPSGSRIAFTSTRSGSSDIWTMAADGTDQRPLAALPGTQESPDWQALPAAPAPGPAVVSAPTTTVPRPPPEGRARAGVGAEPADGAPPGAGDPRHVLAGVHARPAPAPRSEHGPKGHPPGDRRQEEGHDPSDETGARSAGRRHERSPQLEGHRQRRRPAPERRAPRDPHARARQLAARLDEVSRAEDRAARRRALARRGARRPARS